MAKSTVSMKLLIDTKANRVLYAEAGKECVDFLFQILSLPVAIIVDLLRVQGMEGSLPNLYRSLENLNYEYILPDKCKGSFLKPDTSVSVPLLAVYSGNDKLVPDIESHKCTGFFLKFASIGRNPIPYKSPAPAFSYSEGITQKPVISCPSCREKYSMMVEDGSGGIVKGVVSYMVMDDLAVEPMSTITSLTLLNRFNVKDVAALEEKVVTLGFDEAVKLLKSSLQCKTVLTNVFVRFFNY